MNEYVENNMPEYLKNGGKIITVIGLELYRDGGTVGIKCANGNNYYIHQLDKTFHTHYPPDKYNIIRHEFVVPYLIDRIESFIHHSEQKLEYNKHLLNDIKDRNKL